LHLFRLETTEIAMTASIATFEDSTLIKLALAGQVECFSVLMDRHLGTVKRRIESIAPNATDLDDILQEVLLKVWRHLATFRSECSFRTWMTRVAMNEVLQSYRMKRRNPLCQALGDLDAFASQVESPHQSFARLEATKTVRSALAGLPAKYRQVLILRDIEQLTAGETAESLQSTIPAVKTRLFRARLMLSEALKPRMQAPLP
jgi:RNA polymerase sigma-70 factor (ECF subfamily)